jgi:hypothetical protein
LWQKWAANFRPVDLSSNLQSFRIFTDQSTLLQNESEGFYSPTRNLIAFYEPTIQLWS